MGNTCGLRDAAGHLLSTVVRLPWARRAFLYRFDRGSGRLAAVAGWDDGGPIALVEPHAGIPCPAVLERRAVWTPDVLAEGPAVLPEWMRRHLLGEGCRAAVLVPLIARDEALGVLAVAGDTGWQYTAQDIGMVAAVGRLAVLVMEQAERHAAAAERLRHMQVLVEVAGAVGGPLDSHGVARAVVEGVTRVIPDSAAAVWELPSGQDGLRVLEELGFGGADPSRLRLGSPAACLLTSGRGWAIPDLPREHRLLPGEDLAGLGFESALVLPLRHDGTLHGVLGIFTRARRGFEGDETTLLEAIAVLAAVSLANARLAAQRAAQRRAGHALREVGRLILTAADPGDIAHRIADSLRSLLGAQVATVFRTDPESGSLAAIATAGGPAPPAGTFRLPWGAGVAGRAVAERRPVASVDALDDPRILITPEVLARYQNSPHHAILAVPLVVQDRVVGVLSVRDVTGRRFTPEEQGLAQTFADQAALSLEHARTVRRAEERAERLRALSALTRLMTASAAPPEVSAEVARAAISLLGARLARVWLADPEHRCLRVQGSAGSDPLVEAQAAGVTVLPYGKGAVGHVFVTRRPLRLRDVWQERRWVSRRLAREADLHAYAGLPLLCASECLGVLSILFPARGDFTPEEEELMTLLADHAAIAINNAQLFEGVRATRDFLQSIAENSADAIVTTDAAGAITYFSPGAAAMFGHAAEQARGRRAAEFYRGGKEEARAIMAGLRAGRWVRDHETAIRAADGRWVEVSGSFSLLRGPDGSVTGTLGILKDITERRRTEEALRRSEEHLRQVQKLDAVGRLAGGIAHDFNNLLTVIQGRAEILARRLGETDARRDLEVIRSTADQAAALIRQLLAFSRTQALRPRILDLNAVIEAMVTMLRPLVGEDVELCLGTNPALWRVSADRSQIEQVIVNLVVNARHAMPQGGRLTVETDNVELDAAYCRRRPVARPGPYVLLAVSDTGVGMDAETQARVFEPFFTTKARGRGTGLGLATVYGIVKQSGGHIWVYSEPRCGTTFKIYLPRAEGAPEGERPRAEPREPARGEETVLVVEDGEEVRAVAREILTMHGYTVLTAPHPAEATRISDGYPARIDLLVTDLVLPHMTGPELARALVGRRPDLRVLYMSGYPPQAMRDRGELDPDAAFIAKPFTGEALLRKVREVLDGAADRRRP